jgi:hypothetical protein
MGLLAPLAGVLWFGLAVGAGSLMVAGPALADLALFRVEQRWHLPLTPSVFQWYIQPYVTKIAGEYIHPPATAIVEPGNPIGGAFTLPQSFIGFSGTFAITPKTGWPGYTTYTYADYYNGPGKFGPNNGATAPVRLVFPTTGNNPVPTYNGTMMEWTGGNYGLGNPVTPTTTFSGRYDISRGGSINVTPGPRRFGGTFRLFHRPNAGFYQFIYYFTPVIYKAYGDYICFDEGKFGCTPSTFVSSIGDITQIYAFYRYLLTANEAAKAITPTVEGSGLWPTENGNASYIVGVQRYLNHIHPWTTGYAKVHNPKGPQRVITPRETGYDFKPPSYIPTLTVTRYSRRQVWNSYYSSSSYYTTTSRQYLYNVGRIVSMVRPRLIHTYRVPAEPGDPISNTWNVARMWELKVFFLPEPAGLLLLGAGVVALLGLSRMRRR